MRRLRALPTLPTWLIACLVLLLASPAGAPAAIDPIDGRLGSLEACEDFFLDSSASPLGGIFAVIELIFGDINDVPDPAWVLVNKRNPWLETFRSASGEIVESAAIGDYPNGALGDEAVVNYEDFPDVHDSHDMNFFMRLDDTAENDGLLSSFGLDGQGREPGEPGYTPDTLEVEWETGLLTSERTGDGRFFPMSMWPVAGDRVWVNGYWVFDCGHTIKDEVADLEGLHTEIHPPRAIAAMRQQVALPPGAAAPSPVTAIDLFIHGRAGVVVDLLECGGRVILDNRSCPTGLGYTPAGSDSSDGDPSHDIAFGHVGVPIADDYTFTVCAPPLPAGLDPSADPLAWGAEGDGVDPEFTVEPATGACAAARYGPKQVRVDVRLSGSGLTPDAFYIRHMFVGWPGPPTPLRRFRATLDTMHLNEDHDHDGLTPGDDDCECSAFWMSVDRAADEWARLSNHADDPEHHMNDFREGTTKTFSGATWEFLVPEGQPFTVRAFGYDGGVGEGAVDPVQDCLDDHFGHHDLGAHVNILPPFEIPDVCYIGVALLDKQRGTDDPFDVVRRVVTAEEVEALFGVWPSTGQTALAAASSPLHCEVEYYFGVSGAPLTDRVVCESAARAQADFESRGFTVLSVREYREVEFGFTLESVPFDSDGDGLEDGDEVTIHHTDPLDADSDDDGLTDGAEVRDHHTDPLDPDSDDDGLTDGDEVVVHHTDPLDADSDDDGLEDGLEVSVGTDPLDSDSDHDGVADGDDPQFLILAIGALPDEALRAGGNQTSLLALLERLEKRIAVGDLSQAGREIRSLRRLMDGCGAGPDHDDRIVDCDAQVAIRRLLDLLAANLGLPPA